MKVVCLRQFCVNCGGGDLQEGDPSVGWYSSTFLRAPVPPARRYMLLDEEEAQMWLLVVSHWPLMQSVCEMTGV